jgi:hypothetical protein
MYRTILGDQEPDRPLYMAVPLGVYDGILSEPLGVRLIAAFALQFVLFDPDGREALRWIS